MQHVKIHCYRTSAHANLDLQEMELHAKVTYIVGNPTRPSNISVLLHSDVHECSRHGTCNMKGQRCLNTCGSYQCVCMSAWTGNGSRSYQCTCQQLNWERYFKI